MNVRHCLKGNPVPAYGRGRSHFITHTDLTSFPRAIPPHVAFSTLVVAREETKHGRSTGSDFFFTPPKEAQKFVELTVAITFSKYHSAACCPNTLFRKTILALLSYA